MENVGLLALLIQRHRRKHNPQKKRRWWVRPLLTRRMEQGAFNNLIVEMTLNDHETFFNFYRMSPAKYDELLHKVGPFITKKNVVRESIAASERLSLTLRYIMSGDSMVSLHYLYRISTTCISTIIKEVCEVIWIVLKQTVLPNPPQINWDKKAEEFLSLWNFPNCVGAIDGKHVTIKAPANTGSVYFNYKGTFSVVLLALADANYMFTIVDIGAPGSESDGGIFSKSQLGQQLQHNVLKFPDPKVLPGTTINVPHLIVGDAAFPLKPYLMRPYPGQHLHAKKVIFNYRLSRARRVVENTFGIWVARMRLFSKPINANYDTVINAIKAGVCIHNYLRLQDLTNTDHRKYCPPTFCDYEDAAGHVHQGQWRQEFIALQSVGRTGSNGFTNEAAQIRSILSDYFVSSGSIPWQWNKLPQN